MNYNYAKKKASVPSKTAAPAPAEAKAGPGLSMDAMRDALGFNSVDKQRVNLRDAMRQKMEKAFGMDLRSLRLYESQKVDEAGASAVARGNTIVFAPGKLDQSSSAGQALLGHELSHLASQARGEAAGSGFLDSPSLEARADREGAMAAAGQTVYPSPATGSASAALSAGGPIQAKKKTPEERKKEKEEKARKKQEKEAQRAAALASVTLPSQQAHTVTDNKFVPTAMAGINRGASTAASQFGSFAKERIDDIEALEKNKPDKPTGIAPYDWYKKTRKKAVAGAFNGLGLDTAEKLEKASKISAASKSGLGMLSGVQKMSGTYAGIENAEKAGDTQAVTGKKLALAQQGAGVLKSGASMGKSIASTFSSPAAGLAKAGLGYAATGLGMVGSGIGAIKDTHDLYKEHSLRSKMRDQQKAIREKARGGNLTEEDVELLQTQQQAIDHSKGRGTRAGASLVGNLLGVGAGAVEIASLAGGVSAPAAAVAGTVLGGIKTGVNYVGSAVADYQDFKAKRDTAERKYHAREEADRLIAQAEDVEQHGSGPIELATLFDESKAREERKLELAGKLSKNQLQKAQLIAHGVKSGTYDEANDRLALERSKKYTAAAKAGDVTSASLLQGMNIDAAAEGAQETMYKKLGGSDMLSESEDNYRRWNDNDFEAAAQENAESEEIIRKVGKRTYYGDLVKTKAKNFGADSWKSTKSGIKRLGGLAAAPFKATWKGMKKAGSAIKDLAPSEETLEKAWESAKAAPGKAWDSIKPGVSKARTAISSAPGKAAEGAKALYGKALESAKAAPGKAWDSIKTGVSKAGTAISSAPGKISESVKAAPGKIAEGFKTLPGKALESVKPAPGKAWDSVKTGAGKARTGMGKAMTAIASTSGKAWDSVKTGVNKAETAIASTSGKAWDSVKTGAGKAKTGIGSASEKVVEGVKALPGKAKALPDKIGSGIKTGARNAVDYAKYKAGAVSSWYNRGVDQMNMYGDTYGKMGVLDRAAWSMKNLPARLTHSLDFNQKRSEKRKQKYMDRDELARILKEEEEERARGQ